MLNANISQVKLINYNCPNIDIDNNKIKGNFIATKEAKERLQKLNSFIQSDIPILLEGPTGTSKTKTIQVLCDLLGKTLIRFNLSNETSTEDLIGRLGSSDEDSWSNFKFIPGPFSEAFIKGYILLLDEINLGQKTVLQCMEAALDTGEIRQEIAGYGAINFKKHPDFRLVATQNPKSEGFTNQRDNLSEKLISRFTVMEFPPFKIEELKIIAEGIANKNNYTKKEIIDRISNFHYQWVQEEKESQSSKVLFTVRDINSTIKSISKKKKPENPSDAVVCFYGSRYKKKTLNYMNQILKEKYSILYKDLSLIPDLPNDFPECFPNDSLKKAFFFALIAKRNKKHILLVGEKGNGLTQIAKWFSWYFAPKEKRKENFLFLFTPETTVSDLIGKYTPKGESSSSGIIEWIDGPITKAVKYGFSGVFDNISACPSKTIESINGLFDPKDTEEEQFFEIPQNTKEPKIEINEDFFFIGTCFLEDMDKLSPAFLNRFCVINLDDQLEGISEESEKSAINYIIKSISDDFQHNEKLINEIHSIFKEKKLKISDLSKYTKACVRLLKILEDKTQIKEIVQYMKDLILSKNKKKIKIPYFNSK